MIKHEHIYHVFLRVLLVYAELVFYIFIILLMDCFQ